MEEVVLGDEDIFDCSSHTPVTEVLEQRLEFGNDTT